MRRDERGSAAAIVIVLLPLLLTVTLGVLQLGALRLLAARASSAADLATLAAVDDQDDTALVATGTLRLAPDAVAVAREYFARNLALIEPHLAASPADVAARADVAAFDVAPAVDPLTGWRYDRPTVRISASVPVRTTLLRGLLLPDVVAVTVRVASAAR